MGFSPYSFKGDNSGERLTSFTYSNYFKRTENSLYGRHGKRGYERLKTGDIIYMNGSTGEIRIESRVKEWK